MAKARSSAGEHMAHATGVVRAARWPVMPKTGKLQSDGPKAATLARFRRPARQPASFGYHFDGNRPAAFAASYGGPLPIPRMSKLCHQACLFKLGNRPEECLQEYACRNSARTHRSVVGILRPARERAIALVGGLLSEHGVHRIAALLGGASEVRWVENAWAGEAQFSS